MSVEQRVAREIEVVAIKSAVWGGIWGLVGAVNFAVVFVLLAPIKLPGVKEALLALFGFAALIEVIFIYFFGSSLRKRAEPISRSELVNTIAQIVSGLLAIAAVAIAILTSPEVALLPSIEEFVVPVIFSIAVGIRALIHLGQSIIWLKNPDPKEPYAALKELYGFVAAATLTIAVPLVLIYKMPHLNWLGFTASCLLVVLQFYNVLSQSSRLSSGVAVDAEPLLGVGAVGVPDNPALLPSAAPVAAPGHTMVVEEPSAAPASELRL